MSSSPISSPGEKRHQNLFKISPDWRSLVKTQCMNTLNKRRGEFRNRLVDKFRNIEIDDNEESMIINENQMINSDMISQLSQDNQVIIHNNQMIDTEEDGMISHENASEQQLHDQEQVVKSSQKDMVSQVVHEVCSQWNGLLDEPYSHDELIDFVEQVKLELEQEVVQYWEELFGSSSLSQSHDPNAISDEEIEWLIKNQNSIVCFICKKNPLTLVTPTSSQTLSSCSMFNDKTILNCSCGFQFVANPSVTLELINDRINLIITQHNHGNLFTNFNNFHFENAFSNISIRCNVCGANENLF